LLQEHLGSIVAEDAMQDRPTKLAEYKTYIDGKWADAASGKTFQTFDPYTGEPWALIPECDKADVDRAVEAAARAWGRSRCATTAS
jgi:acyl-CoA reductase-like NAD-dependent aldehyde dehydrogenase